MSRVEVNIRFIYEDVLYADTQGYIPRHEAIKIPELKVEQIQAKQAQRIRERPPTHQSKVLKNKKDQNIDEEIVDQNDENEMEIEDGENQLEVDNDNDVEIDNEMEVDEIDEEDIDIDEIEGEENQEIPYEDDDEQDNDIDDLSEISRSISPEGNYIKQKTKRQKGQIDNLLELPLKKPRKDVKQFDEATQLIRKQQKQRKRRQYIKKLNEAQQKATFDKILNETGRKFRQRQQKQLQSANKDSNLQYKTLGDIPKTVTKQTKEGTIVIVNKTQLFPSCMLTQPNVRMRESCNICEQDTGKYKSKDGRKFCSVECYGKLYVAAAR